MSVSSIREKVLEVLKDGRYRTTAGVWYDGRFLPLFQPADIRIELNLMVDEGLISKVRDNFIAYFYIPQPEKPKKVQITIAGLTGSGKTIVGAIIEKALREAGIQVQPFVSKDGDQDFKRDLLEDERMKEVFPTISVVIEENQIRVLSE
jgi:hypothetical protein